MDYVARPAAGRRAAECYPVRMSVSTAVKAALAAVRRRLTVTVGPNENHSSTQVYGQCSMIVPLRLVGLLQGGTR